MKKLIPALCMLLVAATLLGTSTFAWFSMNDRVTANGMTVTAASESIFLEIKGEGDSDFGITGDANMTGALKPVAYTTLENGIEDVNNNWYYQFSKDIDLSNTNVFNKTFLTAGDTFTDYVAKTTYQVQLHQGGGETAYDLYVSSISIPENTGITVIIAGDSGKYVEFKSSATISAPTAENVLFDEVTTSPETITVYIFFDGNDENVTTENIAALTGEVTFTLNAFDESQV